MTENPDESLDLSAAGSNMNEDTDTEEHGDATIGQNGHHVNGLANGLYTNEHHEPPPKVNGLNGHHIPQVNGHVVQLNGFHGLPPTNGHHQNGELEANNAISGALNGGFNPFAIFNGFPGINPLAALNGLNGANGAQNLLGTVPSGPAAAFPNGFPPITPEFMQQFLKMKYGMVGNGGSLPHIKEETVEQRHGEEDEDQVKRVGRLSKKKKKCR